MGAPRWKVLSYPMDAGPEIMPAATIVRVGGRTWESVITQTSMMGAKVRECTERMVEARGPN